MSVLDCNRKGCENIMCDYSISGIGYVCWECRREFDEWLEKQGKEPKTEGEIKTELLAFMATNKKEQFDSDKEMSVSDFFNNNNRR